MPHRGPVRVDAPDMRIDQQLIIGAVERVVERRPVGPDVDAGHADQGPVMHECQLATGLDAVPELLLLTARPNVLALGVAHRDPDRAAVCGALPQEVTESGIRLVQEDGGVHQHVDGCDAAWRTAGIDPSLNGLGVYIDLFREGGVRPASVCHDGTKPLVRHEFPPDHQKRGLVHLHAVIRLDGPDGHTTPPPPWATLDALDHAVRAAA